MPAIGGTARRSKIVMGCTATERERQFGPVGEQPGQGRQIRPRIIRRIGFLRGKKGTSLAMQNVLLLSG